jgi:CSLREA domain-containing protein
MVAAGLYSVASGGQVTVRMHLNPAGMRLLAARYVLPTTLSLGGTTPMTLPVVFSYPVIKSGVGYTWAFGPTSSTDSELTVTRIPQGGKVKVICHGGGCPFAQRTFAARRGRVVLTPAFKRHPLRSGATLVVEIIAANQVGKVETFKIRGGRPPAVGHECLPPGTSRPGRCVQTQPGRLSAIWEGLPEPTRLAFAMRVDRRLMTLTAAALSAAMILALALAAIVPSTASAASTVTVSTTADETQPGDGTCSLREATLYANGTAEPDCAAAPASGLTTIVVPAGLYVLTGGPLSLTGNVAVAGAGAATTTITAAGASQVFVVAATANAAISDVSVTGGSTISVCGGGLCGAGQPRFGQPGGGIANDGNLLLSRVAVTGNRTGDGAINGQCVSANPAGGCGGGNGGDGGGISNSRTGTLTIASSTITGNTTGAGAAGDHGAPDQPAGNSGSGGNGGGINNVGTLTITNSTIADNTTGAGQDGTAGANGSGNGDGGNASVGAAGGSGAGIESSGPLFISGSTLVGNRTGVGGKGANGGNATGTGVGGNGSAGGAGGSGGAIDSTADMTITNSTIVANATAGGGTPGANGTQNFRPQPGPGQPGTGGGINERAMGATLTHVTLTANSAAGVGGGIDGAGGTITAANSIVSGNVAAPPNLNCAGVLVDQGGNVEFAAASCPAGFLHADPRLTGLANNGGPTQTVALQPGSAAIHHVSTCVLPTDQRGVARPVGSACDSGAYQVAPPAVSGVSAGAITTSAATVSASVNPNLQATTVVVNYGTTPSYGSSTPAVALGAGNNLVPFSAAIVGLAPGTTYHFDVVATNADGTTTSRDAVFTTLPPLTASIARAATNGAALSLTIVCSGGSGPGTCSGPISLSARGTPAKTHTTKHRGKHASEKPQVVAAGSYSVASGRQVTVKLRLNRKGQTMLTQHYRLTSTIAVRGTTGITQNVTFSYPLVKSGVGYTWAFGATSSTASELTVTRIPHGGKVKVICNGGGCPFAQRTFAARRGRVDLAPAFKGHPLRAGTTLVIEVIAANQVGKVETFKIRSGQPPAVSQECLPPGTSRPGRCV